MVVDATMKVIEVPIGCRELEGGLDRVVAAAVQRELVVLEGGAGLGRDVGDPGGVQARTPPAGCRRSA